MISITKCKILSVLFLLLSPALTAFAANNITVQSGAAVGACAELNDVILMQLPLPAGIRAEQVENCNLRLYVGKTVNETNFAVGAVLKSWYPHVNPNNFGENDAAINKNLGKTAKTTFESNNGWVSVDVTLIVKRWLSGNIANYGFSVWGDSFVLPTAGKANNAPQLEIIYKSLPQPPPFGKFDFIEQKDGNCFAYALRDKSVIYTETIVQEKSLQYVYDNEGEDGALEFFANKVIEFVEKYSSKLEISSFKRIKSANEKIAEDEYIIAMRLGFKERNGENGIQIDGDFDFHFRVRLKDGTWAEKLTKYMSRVVPGTNSDMNIEKAPWSQGYSWGNEKYNDFYSSKVVYFAVRKDTDLFTSALKP